MKAHEILKKISKMGSFYDVFVPEFTYGDRRIDAVLIDTSKRWIRGFEIKVRREDFLGDNKFTEYSEFCSSICIVCPAGLIEPSEIKKPFGLIWVYPDDQKHFKGYEWKKRPQNFQKRKCLAWLYTYVRVIELEMRRIKFILDRVPEDN